MNVKKEVKMMKTNFIIALAIVFTFLGAESMDAKKEYKISGVVHGLTGKHSLYIALKDKSNWDEEDTVSRLKIDANQISKKSASFEFVVPEGVYGIKVFEDINDDGKLNKGIFGPKEPYGFFASYKPLFRGPNFDECKFKVNKDIDVKISLLNREDDADDKDDVDY